MHMSQSWPCAFKFNLLHVSLGNAPLTLLFLQLEILVYVKKHLSEKRGDVMYRAAKHVGIKTYHVLWKRAPICQRIKHVEFNLEA